MVPVPQEQLLSPTIVSSKSDEERIVISGMSGLYPQSRSVNDFSEILYNKINPIGSEGLRYKFKHPEVVDHVGSIPDIGKFDAQFFRVHYRLANTMDAMSRKILEQAYQAIYDAGVNPDYLSGKKVGVYVGSCFSETEKVCFYDPKSRTGFGIAGCSKAMFANRISYWLNAKGPSMSIDEACCSSTAALEQAYLAMSRGDCEAAVVAGSFLCLHPQSSVHYGRTLKLCLDGKTKAFCEKADGCAKSEAINVLFLQKAKDAVRIYADVLHVKCEYIGLENGETGPKYGFYREPRANIEFLKKFYDEARVAPQAIEYVEAVGSGTPEVDKVELDTIDEVFCSNRYDTLLVGSVMSNIGYNEAASGITAVTKVLLGYHTGKLVPNLHCERPRQDVACLREGRVQIITEPQPWRRGYVAINGMSVTGVNSHVLLYGHYKPKDLSRYTSSIPYLVPISGRQDSAVQNIIDNLKSRAIDPEELALLHNIHQYNGSGLLGRGYVILGTNDEQKTVSLSEKAAYYDDARRPLWFVYSGMGSQWPTMGAQLMRIPIFAAAIQSCHKILQPKGINIVDIITLPDKNMFDNILHSFVGIAAIQIGLTDVLKAIGLVPDGIIGHSVGELGCAYADGCLTAEEMILSAYSRGLVSLQTPFIRGSMAAVGVGYSQLPGDQKTIVFYNGPHGHPQLMISDTAEIADLRIPHRHRVIQTIKEMCPPEIEVACHNGPESCTISGPAEAMSNFVAELTAKGIFAKEVPCSNIAYHSRYIASAGPGLLKYLKEVIPNPRPRSEKWISSSVPQGRWGEPLAKYSSAEYHTNNLLSPVLFEESSRLIPSNAVVVEVAPHGLLQAILKRSLSPDCVNIPITRRNHQDNVIMLLEAIGTLYTKGYPVKVQNLYPKVQFPVSTGTPLLSHLVEWAHGEQWPISLYSTTDSIQSACCKFVVSLFDKEHAYFRGNKIRGQTLFPFAAALVYVWDTLAMVMGVPKKRLSVQFRDVYFYSQPILHDKRQLSLYIVLHRGTGNFEVLEDNNAKVVTGFITPVNTKTAKIIKPLKLDVNSDRAIQSENLYQWFEDRGYSYSDKFRSIVSASSKLDQAELVRDDNWVTLIDGMLQLYTLRQPYSSVSVPSSIRSLGIDVEEHNRFASLGQKLINIEYLEKHDFTCGGGVVMENVLFTNFPKLQQDVLMDTLVNKNEKQGLHIESSNAILVSKNIGDYNSLEWIEAPEPSSSKGVVVKVEYVGITNTDFKKASGAISLNSDSDNTYGMDFSGIVESGERVMGIVPKGACSRQIQATPDLLWPVPGHWNSEDAATVPFPYLHAFYLLVFKGRLAPGMNVLVHGGAGALGQAAIAVALAHECAVFTTVGDIRKKRFLQRLFPKLKGEFIGNSRDATFKDTVLTATNGRGCEIILSSLKNGHKQSNFECCAFTGIVIDANQIQDHENFQYGMAAMFKQRSYCLSDFSSFILNGDRNKLKDLQSMLSEGIARGYVRPLTRVTFAAHQAPRGFRLLAASGHRGRVLLDLRTTTNAQALPAVRRITCNADFTQLIISRKNNLGLYLAERLILRGAKRILLNLKPDIVDLIQPKIQSWKNQGVEIMVTTSDFDSVDKLITLLDDTKLHCPIEGVYLVDIQEIQIISLLDHFSRHQNSYLKYFAVINSVSSIGQNVCVARQQHSLPTTMLSLTNPDESIWASKNEWYDFAVEAIEQALISPWVALAARPKKAPNKSLLQELLGVAGITLDKNITKETTRQDLELDYKKLELISNLLKNKYNIHYDKTQLSGLTIERINALEKAVIQTEFVKLEGLSQFINYVNPDELLATVNMVPLPTLVSTALEGTDNVDPNKKYLFIVPGLEGLHERFRVLCERLKLPALVLQPGLDNPHQSLQDLAKRYAQDLLTKTGLTGHFYLMGYESGMAVALEVAGILEEEGFTGTIFCLGCTTNDFQKIFNEELKKYKTKDELREAILYYMFKLMAGHDTTALDAALKTATTWHEKVDACVRTLLGRVSHSAQYARELIETTFARIVQTQNYQVTERRLLSKIVYLRAAGYTDSSLADLQRHSQQSVIVHQLSEPLAYAAMDLRCATIINDCLPREMLDAYDDGNICDSYMINPDSYMSFVVEK